MPRVTVYLDTKTNKRLNRMANAAGLSRSRWVADLIREATSTRWPDSLRRALATSNDFPELEQIRQGIDR